MPGRDPAPIGNPQTGGAAPFPLVFLFPGCSFRRSFS